MRGSFVAALILCAVFSGCAGDLVTPSPEPKPDASLALRLERYKSSGIVAVSEVVGTGSGIRQYGVMAGAPRADARVPAAFRMDFPESDLQFIVNPAGPHTGGAPNTITINWSFYCYDFATDQWKQLFQVDILDALQEAIENTGGHGTRHSLPAKPVGRWNPKTGTTSGAGIWTSTFTSGIASGDELITFKTNVRDEGDCKGNVEFYALSATRYRGLQELQGFPFGTITSDHASVFYATATMAGHASAADGFYSAATGGTRFVVTAASLIYGGINDVNRNWTNPHVTHRIGTELDIDGSSDTQPVWDRLMRAGRRGGFARCEVHNRNHVHCYDN